MADLNSCAFVGRLVRDAENKILPTGTQLVTFDIANNIGFGEHEKVMYLTVNLWGKSGQGVFKYLTKGKQVGVSGQLEVQKWTSTHDGSTQQKNVLNCSNISLISSPQNQHPQAVEVQAEYVSENEEIQF